MVFTIISKINQKIEEYLQKILEKDEISKEEFDVLVAYRNMEESREAMKLSMAAITSSMGAPADVKHVPLAAYDEKEVN